MRLYKKAAAVLLAAAMAVSMMTACGGGGGSTGGNGGGSGNNGGSTSVAVPAPDKFENVGTGSESEGAPPAIPASAWLPWQLPRATASSSSCPRP